MRARVVRRLAVVALALAGTVAAQAPVVPGLAGAHGLDELGAARVLAAELRCGACHLELERLVGDELAAPAPDLADVGARLRPDFLRRYLLEPAVVHPGTRMPAVLHARHAEERELAADAITHYLVGRGGGAPLADAAAPSADEVAAGERLFHTVGCVACHAPRRPPQDGDTVPAHPAAVPLEHVPDKYTRAGLAAFLFEPLRTHPAGRMPDLWLKRGEARALAAYLLDGVERSEEAFEPDPDLVAVGERAYRASRCADCHEPGFETVGTPPLRDAGAGCLAPSEQGAAPRYRLDDGQRALLRVAVEAARSERPPERTDAQRADETLVALNCVACHARDGRGGVAAAVNPYFETTEHGLGDEARVPPRLDRVGAKLTHEWLRRVLLEDGNRRDYMLARMPRFRAESVAHLPELFERLDEGSVEPYPLPLPEEGDEARALRDAGRELTGIRGLACIACHDFNGTPSPTHEGIDLVLAAERVRPSWFARFLIDPQGFRPGIVMPEGWPDGVASHRGILDGDTEAQLRALWCYLAEGRTARDPEGIRPEPAHLAVGDAPRLYRGRSRVAGFRGIAVGFPGGLSYAFDAQHGALAALWSGRFVGVRWDGQGAGDFHPLEPFVELPRDVGLQALPSPHAPWPLRPVTTEEQPVDPDPLYPRRLGYRFRGYALGADGVPTLRYAVGDVEVAERVEPDGAGALVRRLTLAPAPAAPLYLRVLAGDVALEGDVARQGRLALRLPDLPHHLRIAVSGERPTDLLVELPPGTEELELTYALED